jgi:hypothetical protein
MGSEQNKAPRKNIALITIIGIVFVLLVYYSIMSALSPGKKLEELRTEYGAKASTKKNIDKKIIHDSEYLHLLTEKAFLQSRIAMAGTDSSYLALNMSDSSANVEICGVAVHKSKMSKMQMSKILSATNENAILALLSAPFTITSSVSTIKKEPVLFQMAPKDTSEYKPDVMPDTTITEPVNYILETNQGVRIFVYQQENVKMEDRMSQFKFDLNYRLKDTWSAIKKVAAFKIPEYHPFIKIKLPRTDAKIIYRAVPKNGQIALFY